MDFFNPTDFFPCFLLWFFFGNPCNFTGKRDSFRFFLLVSFSLSLFNKPLTSLWSFLAPVSGFFLQIWIFGWWLFMQVFCILEVSSGSGASSAFWNFFRGILQNSPLVEALLYLIKGQIVWGNLYGLLALRVCVFIVLYVLYLHVCLQWFVGHRIHIFLCASVRFNAM